MLKQVHHNSKVSASFNDTTILRSTIFQYLLYLLMFSMSYFLKNEPPFKQIITLITIYSTIGHSSKSPKFDSISKHTPHNGLLPLASAISRHPLDL